MIYIATALYPEAKPFIKGLGLKRADENKLQIFKNDDFILIITGTGTIDSAVSLSYALGRFLPSKNDVFVNVGCCGGGRVGELYVCNKITDFSSGRDVYPDMIYNSGREEMPLISYVRPKSEIPEGTLGDMEGYGLYVAASAHFYAHKMFFFKISSDVGEHKGVTAEFVAELVNKYWKDIAEFSERVYSEGAEAEFSFSEAEIKEIERLGLTHSNTLKVKNLLKYYKLGGGDALRLLKDCPTSSLKREEGELVEKIRNLVL